MNIEKIIKKIKNKIIEKNKKEKFLFNEKDFISPTYINLNNPKYNDLDETY